MKLLSIAIAAAFVTTPLLASAGSPFATAAGAKASALGQTDRLIVKYKQGAASAQGFSSAQALSESRSASLTRAGNQFGLSMKRLHDTVGGASVVHLGKRMPVEQVAAVAASLAAGDASIEYAEPDRIMTHQFTPNDTRYNEQWAYFDSVGGMRANLAWDVATGTGINVAVLDTGYRPHADLSGQIVGGYDFIDNIATANDGNGRDSDARDPGDWTAAGECGAGVPASGSSWHGTHVAGSIAARSNNAMGVAGTAFNAKIVPVRVLGKCGGYNSDIAAGIAWAAGGSVTGVPANPNRARVINLSLGGAGTCSTTTQNAINTARSLGAIVVVAAGNDNTDASGFTPANCAGVVTVAATNRSGGRAYYSNYGSTVDVAAPGGDVRTSGGGILSTLNSSTTAPGADSYAYYQGTSMAAPHVSGVIALMLSKTPGLTPDQVESTLKSTARAFPASCSGCGAGIVDAQRAVGVIVPGNSETESNNTIGTANPVTTNGVTLSGTMGTSTDTDYFVVQVPAGRTLTATMTPGLSTADYDLFGYNSAGTELAASERTAGLTDTITLTNSGTTTVARYVRVTYYGGGTGSTSGKYSLKLSW